jgi:hypothetical protein
VSLCVAPLSSRWPSLVFSFSAFLSPRPPPLRLTQTALPGEAVFVVLGTAELSATLSAQQVDPVLSRAQRMLADFVVVVLEADASAAPWQSLLQTNRFATISCLSHEPLEASVAGIASCISSLQTFRAEQLPVAQAAVAATISQLLEPTAPSDKLTQADRQALLNAMLALQPRLSSE